MTKHDPKKETNLFYTCSLIEFIARATKNSSREVVHILGEGLLDKIYNNAEKYIRENISSVCKTFIEQARIQPGGYDPVARAEYSVPTCWDIGKIYTRLIFKIYDNQLIPLIDALIEVYNSIVSEKIDDYNCSFYYEPPEYIYMCYKERRVI